MVAAPYCSDSFWQGLAGALTSQRAAESSGRARTHHYPAKRRASGTPKASASQYAPRIRPSRSSHQLSGRHLRSSARTVQTHPLAMASRRRLATTRKLDAHAETFATSNPAFRLVCFRVVGASRGSESLPKFVHRRNPVSSAVEQIQREIGFCFVAAALSLEAVHEAWSVWYGFLRLKRRRLNAPTVFAIQWE